MKYETITINRNPSLAEQIDRISDEAWVEFLTHNCTRHWRSLCALAFLLCGLLISQISAAAGDLDPSFGTGGIVITPITNPPYFDSPSSMLVQPDGKIVVSGFVSEDDPWGDSRAVAFFLIRYNPTGTLDTSFGTNGKIISDFASVSEFVGVDLALQPDGKIVAVGSTSSYNYYFAINRYNSNGTLDSSFGAGGRVVTRIGNNFEFALSVAVQPDGKIIVAGYSFWGGYDFNFSVVRYNPNGSLDNSFGTGGKVTTSIGDADIANKVLLQPDGKIVVVGSTQPQGAHSDFALVRYNADGSLDSGFGVNGKVIYSIPNRSERVFDAALQPDGKIIAAGYTNSGLQTAIVRFNADGSIDTSFAANGIFTTAYYDYFVGNSIVLQPDGKLLAFGYGSIAGSEARKGFAVARLNANGSPDASFGTNGRLTTPIGTTDSVNGVVAGALQPDGKILAFGGTSAPNDNIVITRYLGEMTASPPTKFDFDGDGKSDISVFRPSDGVWYLNQSSSGFAAQQFGIATDKIVPADYDGDGKTDIAVYRNGTWYLQRSRDGFLSVGFGLPTDIPVPADFDGDGKSELAVFRPSNGVWYSLNLVNNGFNAVQFGSAEDDPEAADYDGDGKADQAVYRPSNGTWYMLKSRDGFDALQFGKSTDIPDAGDYDGDGRADQAVYRQENGAWYIFGSKQGFSAIQFGIVSDLPVAADYDGDGKTDVAVFRNGTWYLLGSQQGFGTVQFGIPGDKPIANACESCGAFDY